MSRVVPFMSILLPTWLLSSRQVPSITTARVQLEACPSLFLSLYEPTHVFPFITPLIIVRPLISVLPAVLPANSRPPKN